MSRLPGGTFTLMQVGKPGAYTFETVDLVRSSQERARQ